MHGRWATVPSTGQADAFTQRMGLLLWLARLRLHAYRVRCVGHALVRCLILDRAAVLCPRSYVGCVGVVIRAFTACEARAVGLKLLASTKPSTSCQC